MSSSGSVPPSLISTALIVISVVFPLLSLLSIILRIAARRAGDLELLKDDLGIIATWVITFGLSVNAWVFGSIMGINQYKIDPLEGESRGAQCLWTQSLILQVSFTLVKISILFFYGRIFITPKFKIAVWVAVALISAWGLVFFFLVIFQVDPVSTAWTGQGRFTIDATAFGLAQAGTSIGLDVVVLGFPLPMIARLHMRTTRKVAVAMILWLGVFCVVAAIVRLVLLSQSLATVTDSHDSGFSQIAFESKAYIFTIIEPNCSIIAASLPCLGPLFKGGRGPESLVRSVRSIFSVSSRRSKSSDGANSKTAQTLPEQSRKTSVAPVNPGNGGEIELNKLVNPWARDVGSEQNNTVVIEPLTPGPSREAQAESGHQIQVTKTFGTDAGVRTL